MGWLFFQLPDPTGAPPADSLLVVEPSTPSPAKRLSPHLVYLHAIRTRCRLRLAFPPESRRTCWARWSRAAPSGASWRTAETRNTPPRHLFPSTWQVRKQPISPARTASWVRSPRLATVWTVLSRSSSAAVLHRQAARPRINKGLFSLIVIQLRPTSDMVGTRQMEATTGGEVRYGAHPLCRTVCFARDQPPGNAADHGRILAMRRPCGKASDGRPWTAHHQSRAGDFGGRRKRKLSWPWCQRPSAQRRVGSSPMFAPTLLENLGLPQRHGCRTFVIEPAMLVPPPAVQPQALQV